MTQPMTDELYEKLAFFMKGEVNAIKLSIDMIYVCHLWDDLIDRDRERGPEDIHKALRIAFAEMPSNPLYQAYQQQFSSLMASAACQYIDSTKLEKGNDDEKLTAFWIRNALLSVLHYCMFLVGGPEWVAEQGPEFWRTFGLTNAKFQEFLKEESANEQLS